MCRESSSREQKASNSEAESVQSEGDAESKSSPEDNSKGKRQADIKRSPKGRADLHDLKQVFYLNVSGALSMLISVIEK